MTKILANNIKGEQKIFDSYRACSEYFKRPQNLIKYGIESGEPLPTHLGVWFFDLLEEEK